MIPKMIQWIFGLMKTRDYEEMTKEVPGDDTADDTADEDADDDADDSTEPKKKRKKGDRPQLMLHSAMTVADKCFNAWQGCYPMEIARKLRPIRHVGKWKMIEGRTFLVYIMVPLFYQLRHLGKAKEIWPSLNKLLLAVHLIAGYGLRPLPQVRQLFIILF